MKLILFLLLCVCVLSYLGVYIAYPLNYYFPGHGRDIVIGAIILLLAVSISLLLSL